MSEIQDTNPMRSIIGKCTVLYFTDYCKSKIHVKYKDLQWNLRIMDTLGHFQLSLVERLSSSRRSIYTQNVQLVYLLSEVVLISECPCRRFHCIGNLTNVMLVSQRGRVYSQTNLGSILEAPNGTPFVF